MTWPLALVLVTLTITAGVCFLAWLDARPKRTSTRDKP